MLVIIKQTKTNGAIVSVELETRYRKTREELIAACDNFKSNDYEYQYREVNDPLLAEAFSMLCGGGKYKKCATINNLLDSLEELREAFRGIDYSIDSMAFDIHKLKEED